MGSQEERAEGRGRGWALQQSNEEANRLTRECLRIAVLQLSGSKSFDAMTVTEVAKRAGVSRSLFLRIFATQNSRFVLGILQQSLFAIDSSLFTCGKAILCPCQKQPFTKIQVRYLRRTKSGCPGNRLWFSLYLKPRFHNPRRTIISGFVSFDRMAAIVA